MDSEKYVTTLDAAALSHAREFLNENEESRDVAIAAIRKWLSDQKHLNARTDSLNLVRFLRGGKFNFDRTIGKIESFYMLRQKTPEWYENRDPMLPELQDLLNLGVFLPIPKRDAEGRVVILIRAAVHKPKVHKQNDVFKLGNMTLEYEVENDESISVYGVVAIIDLNGVTLGHARQMTPSIIKKAVHSWQDCYPLRIKGLHFINAPTHVNVVLSIFKQFMTAKLKSRVQVHGFNLDSFHQKVSPDILPKEYGGTNGELQELIDHWKTKVTEARLWFLENK
ncbi:retinol-binding protein pinta isoform X2 [Nilaparvata lugens]|nr:retinol-binding protein pinta isoform X2 [Nilaparvata lugens]XP_039291307.1 retinol-binding protein pinta isoform X2 [Nilaparvata lugens]XP_039291315.1 retinol-binding protein pinta isoform X2 [Nilaparvata lugens]XP_039291323.1 retinol-binding protein pinta isoform X2 [Nilaparvata lugens]XP_039291330.1 retinol-binding protein pinta isoform X2 [Nilaparvata lugens]XP_039291337.1 retinol-binding protein pinta isoform X2 [Nilaparvata lugens]XP_039291344.1 retinol-binding protein pinta isoform 